MPGWTDDRIILPTRGQPFEATEFIFKKALAMEAFRLFEILRPALTSFSDTLQKALNRHQNRENLDAIKMTALIEIIGKLPQETVRDAMTHLSQYVYFCQGSDPQQKVSTNLDSAFAGLSVVQIYEVLIRAFLVNFQTSFDDLQSLTPSLKTSEDIDNPKT